MNGSKDDDPVVSVCIPAYNEEQFLGQTIESVLNQTFENFEIVITDDGSTDGTRDLVRSYADNDERIQYIYQENAGVATAQNTAIEHATGQYIAILEADDLWVPEMLERSIDFIRGQGVDMTHSNAYNIDLTGAEIGIHHDGVPPIQENRDEFLRTLFIRNFICTPTVVIRREIIGDRPFDESFDQSHDHDLWLRIAAEHNVAYINELLAKKRYHNENLSGNYENAFKMRQKLINKSLERYDELESVVNEKRASIHMTVGLHRIIDGKMADGRRALRESVGYNPTALRPYITYLLSFISPALIDLLSKQSSLS